ncbi:hypothetical protein HID58_046419 [Brassica napus]|uniref:Uncharacterized protein n=1 Tax=Brassica napus TaxID=3708 RepID=A0ABQ8AWF8_BRANA|nr:hypothetical protein HID58_046419 [Brassica napus]
MLVAIGSFLKLDSGIVKLWQRRLTPRVEDS